MTTIATSKDALAQAKTRMEKAVEDFRKDLATVRTGRANVALLDAMEELDRVPRTHVAARSSLYRSAPVGYAEQPDFVNAVTRLETELSAERLLEELLAIVRRAIEYRRLSSEVQALRQRLADAWIGLRIMRFNALRTLSQGDGTELGREALITKLYWATWHRTLGKLAMDVLGADGEIAAGAPYALARLQRLFLFTRADTIYAGTNQIQRNIIAERALGLPREPRPTGGTQR